MENSYEKNKTLHHKLGSLLCIVYIHIYTILCIYFDCTPGVYIHMICIFFKQLSRSNNN